MNKLVTMLLAASMAAASVPAIAASHAGAQKDDMKKDRMMKKDEMKKDGMAKKDAMKKDEMKKDGMMKKDEMKK